MSAPLRFAGYAALFGRVDRGGDVIERGAFSACLERIAGRRLPLLWQHKAEAMIGTIEHVSEDERGLRVIGRIEAEDGLAGDAIAALRAGRVDGLSFGYRVERARGEAPRRLIAIDIAEVSLVTHPMQPMARVHALA